MREINISFLYRHMYRDIFTVFDVMVNSIASDVPFDAVVDQTYCQPAREECSRWRAHVILN